MSDQYDYVPRTERCTKTIDELERDYASELTPPINAVIEFVHSTTAATFEDLYARLSPRFREHVRDFAERNLHTFEEVLQDMRQRGEYVDGMTAYRDWSFQQPWAQKALREPRPKTPAVTAGELERRRQRFSEQGWMLAELRVCRMRAQTDEDRATIDRQIAEMLASFEKENWG